MEQQRNDYFWLIIGLVLLITLFVTGLIQATKNKNLNQEKLVSVKVTAEIADAKEIKIAGTFNNWRERCCLVKEDESNKWSIKFQLMPGMYEYVLIVDGVRWDQAKLKNRLNDGLGGRNSILYVKKRLNNQGGGNV